MMIVQLARLIFTADEDDHLLVAKVGESLFYLEQMCFEQSCVYMFKKIYEIKNFKATWDQCSIGYEDLSEDEVDALDALCSFYTDHVFEIDPQITPALIEPTIVSS